MTNLTNCFRGLAFVMASGTIFGASWRQINSGLPATVAGVSVLTVDPKTPSTVYASTVNGSVFKTRDGGGSWTPVSTVTGVNSLLVDAKNSFTLYAGTAHGIVKSLDGGETWTGANTGLSPGWTSSVVADPKNSSTIYAVTGNTLFKSTDGAETWNPIAAKFYYSFAEATIPLAEALYYANALVIDPKNSSTMYVAVFAYNSGLYKSTDGGSTWYPATSPAKVQFNSQAMPVFDPANPSTIYLAYNDFDSVTRQRKAYFLKSTDDGVSWDTIGDGFPPDSNFWTLAIDPATPSNVYATYGGDNGWGVAKSADGGRTFSKLDTGLPPYNTGSVLAISPTSPSTVYAGYVDFSRRRGQLVKSKDGGANWNAADAGLTLIDVRTLAIDPANTSTLYAGMGGGAEGVFKSVNGGANWSRLAQFQITGTPAFSVSPLPQGEPGIVNSLLIGGANPNILYASTARLSGGCIYTDKLFFKSTDGGVSWNDIANPSGGGCGFFFSSPVLALDPTDSDDLYLGGGGDCGGAWLDKSPNGGLDWRSLSNGFASTLNALVIDPTNAATLYAATPEGVFKSTNGGAAWNNAGLTTGVAALAVDRVIPGTVYAATGGSYSDPGFHGLFKSVDGGASWASINNGLAGVIDTHSSVTALAIGPDNGILYAATSGHGVYKSSDGGANWAPFNDGLTNRDVRALTISPKAPNTLYALTPGGTFRMMDETALAAN